MWGRSAWRLPVARAIGNGVLPKDNARPALNKSGKAPSPSVGEGGGEGTRTFHYQDIPGFCKNATLEEIRQHGYVLTPGRYVGAEAQEDDAEPFEEKMRRLVTRLREQQAEARRLDEAIWKNLKELSMRTRQSLTAISTPRQCLRRSSCRKWQGGCSWLQATEPMRRLLRREAA